jgi:hypothetical protein
MAPSAESTIRTTATKGELTLAWQQCELRFFGDLVWCIRTGLTRSLGGGGLWS